MSNIELNPETYLFNTPLEIGLRCVALLVEMNGMDCDLQRLIYYDYLLVHFGDIDKRYKSIHSNTPHRVNEILVKREALASGLLLMCKKQLVSVKFSQKGITYHCTKISCKFLDYFKSEYMKEIINTAKLVIEKFGEYTDNELNEYMMNNLDKWCEVFTDHNYLEGERSE